MKKQKRTTKNTTTEKKEKQTRRDKEKHPALSNRFNLKMRSDYIDTDHVDGVKNEDGDLVIRAFTKEEKDFYNKFYEEVVNANFHHDKEVKRLYRKLKRLEKNTNPSDADIEEWSEVYADYLQKKDESLLYKNPKEQKKLYGENNARNRCIYNRKKASGALFHIEDNRYNTEEDQTTTCEESGTVLLKDDFEHGREEIVSNRKKRRSELLFGKKKKD